MADQRAGEQAGRGGERERAARRSSSSTGSGCCRAAGTTGSSSSRRPATRPLTPDWPDDPETVEEARANPDVLAKKTLKQVADHTAEVIGDLDEEARGDGPLDRRPARPDHRRPRPLRRDRRDRSRSVPRGPAAARLGAAVRRARCCKNPLNRGKAITLTLDQFKYGWANALERRRGEAALRDLPRRRAGIGADADGERQPQPVHRGQARPEEPGPRPAADHRRREGPHGSRGRSRTPPTSDRGATRRSPRSSRSRTAATR